MTSGSHLGIVEVGGPPAGCHSGALLHVGGCSGLGHPEAVSPAWRQPCGILTEEPSPPGPSRGQAMTTSEDQSPAQPGGTDEQRWVLRV